MPLMLLDASYCCPVRTKSATAHKRVLQHTANGAAILLESTDCVALHTPRHLLF